MRLSRLVSGQRGRRPQPIEDRAGDRAFLVDDEGTYHPLGASTSMGRAEGNDILASDPLVSRHHLRIAAEAGGYVLRDLDSSNGTRVNGERVRVARLGDGDQVSVGGLTYRFLSTRVHEESLTCMDAGRFSETRMSHRPSTESAQVSDAATVLQAIYEISKEISGTYDVEELCAKILRVTARALSATQAALFFVGPHGALTGLRGRDRVPALRAGEVIQQPIDEVSFSPAIAARVCESGQTVYFQDESTTNVLRPDESRLAPVPSVLGVPLLARDRVMGVLYVDIAQPPQTYCRQEMILATAIGNSGGLALENALLHQQMLAQQQVEREIEWAWSIQEGFLAKDWGSPDPRFEVYGCTVPARVVGGDFYDYAYCPGSERVALLIGDVSGKGVPAALTMAKLLAEFQLLASRDPEPLDIVRALNTRLAARSQRGMFCSMVVAVLELATGVVRCVNAGHQAPLILGSDAARFAGAASGLPVGVLDSADWQVERLQVEPGELLLLYTDGVIEARMAGLTENGDGPAGAYGEERLARLACEHLDRGEAQTDMPGQASASHSLIEWLMQDVRAFTAPEAPHDDCTMIGLRYRGQAA